MDDVYICDGVNSGVAGLPNNDFLGDIAVVALYPTGSGGNTTWSPDTGSNYARVNEAVADGDTSWVQTGTAGNVDSYAYGALAGAPASIYGVTWNAEARKTDASTYKIRRFFKAGGISFPGSTDYSLPTTYVMNQEVLQANPATSAAWTAGDLAASEWGVKLDSVV